MSNINVGTIFALEAKLPKFGQVAGLSDMKSKERLNALKNFSYFSDLKENIEISEYLLAKEHELLNEANELTHGDDFFETLLWLRHNMVQIRKIYREVYFMENKDMAKRTYNEKINLLPNVDEKFILELENFYQELPEGLSVFELEKKLDELYFELLKKKTGRNKIKKEYAKLFVRSFREGVKSRISYLSDEGELETADIDKAGQEFSEKEIEYVNRAVTEMDENLIVLSYITKIKYLMYNLQIVFSDFGDDTKNYLIDYSF